MKNNKLNFKYDKVVIDYKDLKYNPCNDLIFPTICEITEKQRVNLHASLKEAKYLMYYAPHNDPGGICLAYSNDINGNWTEYNQNPLIKNVWSDYYEATHVSSPHLIWNDDEEKFFLYFHGNNHTTRLATTLDGVNFQYEGVALSYEICIDFDDIFYARVFKWDKANNPYKYVMFFVGRYKNSSDTVIAASWSIDGRCWSKDYQVIIPTDKEHPNVAAHFIEINGENYLFYHRDTLKLVRDDDYDCFTDIAVVKIDNDLNVVADYGVVYNHLDVSSTNDRVSDPCPIIIDDEIILLHTNGSRLKQKIAVAKMKLDDWN